MTINLLANAAEVKNSFGFMEAMEQGGPVAWFILAIMIIMSVGSFYILITKLLEQNKVMKQYRRDVQGKFWQAGSIKEGATKLEKNSAWRQVADDALKAEDEHGKMTDKLEAHDWMHGSLQRSEDSINAKIGRAHV